MLRNNAGFSQYVSRSQMDGFKYGSCRHCKETVVHATVRAKLKDYDFDPKPIGGSEIDPAYDVHRCAKPAD